MPAIQEEVGQLLQDKGLTIVVAEACTAGLVGSMLCSVPGSSRYFYGGVITYAGGLKTRLLGIPEEFLQREGSVSPAAALEMARKAWQLLDADVGVSTTGVAGPNWGLFEPAHRVVLRSCGGPRRVRGHQRTPLGRRQERQPGAHGLGFSGPGQDLPFTEGLNRHGFTDRLGLGGLRSWGDLSTLDFNCLGRAFAPQLLQTGGLAVLIGRQGRLHSINRNLDLAIIGFPGGELLEEHARVGDKSGQGVAVMSAAETDNLIAYGGDDGGLAGCGRESSTPSGSGAQRQILRWL